MRVQQVTQTQFEVSDVPRKSQTRQTIETEAASKAARAAGESVSQSVTAAGVIAP